MTKQQQWILNNKLTENQRRYVLPRYEKRKKDLVTAYLMWLFIGTYYFYLKKPVLNLAIWLCIPLMIGIIWLIVDLFRIPGMVNECNDELLMSLVRESKEIM